MGSHSLLKLKDNMRSLVNIMDAPRKDLVAMFRAPSEWVFEYCYLTGFSDKDHVEAVDVNHLTPPFLLLRADIAEIMFYDWKRVGLQGTDEELQMQCA